MRWADRQLREAALFAPVRRWLKARGFTVYAEVCRPGGGGPIDVVAVRPRWLYPVAIELKTGFTPKLLRQGAWLQAATPYVFIAAPTRPRAAFLSLCDRVGLGVLRIHDDRVTLLAWPITRCDVCRPSTARLWESLRGLPEAQDGEAGLPTLAGTGPAQAVARDVRRYLAEHPAARWRDVYRDVPNHYSNLRSLAGVMNHRFGLSLANERPPCSASRGEG